MRLVLLARRRAERQVARSRVELAARDRLPVVFVATGEAGDDEMAERIAAHRGRAAAGVDDGRGAARARARDRRGRRASHVLVVDCLSLWVANCLRGTDAARRGGGRGGGAAVRARPGLTIAVTNEVGLGVVPATELGRALPRRARPR